VCNTTSLTLATGLAIEVGRSGYTGSQTPPHCPRLPCAPSACSPTPTPWCSTPPSSLASPPLPPPPWRSRPLGPPP
jgi:hypothetical protein